MTVNVKLKDLVCNDAACDAMGLDPWCVAEGADGDATYQVDLCDAIKWGIITEGTLLKRDF